MVIVKILVYAIILCAIKFTIAKIQKPREDITTTLLGERFIDYKIFSNIYLILSIGITAILVFALSLPSNEGTEKNIVVIVFVLVILFFFFMSLLYSRIYIKIGKNRIQWRKMNGKEEKIKYEDITSYKVEGGNNLELYQEDICVLNFPMEKNKVFITEVLKNHKVPQKEFLDGKLVLKEGKFSVIFAAVFCSCSLLMLILNLFYGSFVGIFIFFVCFIIFFRAFIETITNKIIIEEETILEKNLFHTHKMNFEDVKYLSLKKEKDMEKIFIYSNQGTIIKVPKKYQNIELFERFVKKQHWKYK